eukprot:TRINITY_DN5214_c3_g1_i1.p1 TRINITY_DN5214_c3_g1~~TRINITY_DN5214_c3_g1_i1.p1  ORF type:complete len:331 (-),score=73.58 TRINITY_DN5214_c3_g1_i1:77-1069(-)
MSHPECTPEVLLVEEADCTLAAAVHDDFLKKVHQFTEFVELFITGPSSVSPCDHIMTSFDDLDLLCRAFASTIAFDSLFVLEIERLCISLHNWHDGIVPQTSSVLLPEVADFECALAKLCLVDFVSWQTWIDGVEKLYMYGSGGEICGRACGDAVEAVGPSNGCSVVHGPPAAYDFVYVCVHDDLTIGSTHRVAHDDQSLVECHYDDDLKAPYFLVEVARLLRTDIHTFKEVVVGCDVKNFDNSECIFNLVVNTFACASSFSHVLEFFDKMVKSDTSFLVKHIVSTYELHLKRPNYRTLMMLLKKQLDKKGKDEIVSISLLLDEIAEFTN